MSTFSLTGFIEICMNESISMFGLEEYKDLTSHTTWWDGFNPGLECWLARSFPPSTLYALDRQDNDEIKNNSMVWVIDTSKPFNFVIVDAIPLQVKEVNSGEILSSWETFSPHAHNPVKNILRNYLQ